MSADDGTMKVIASGNADTVLEAIAAIEPGYDPEAILADPDALQIHKTYAFINIGVRDRGERWSKCANCGQPYMLTTEYTEAWGEPWEDETVCSKTCFTDYLAYINGV